MRLFLIGWEMELVGVAEELQKKGYQIVYWTLSSGTLKLSTSSFPTTIFHDLEDVLCGKPAQDVDESTFLPPEEDLLKQLSETESIVLTMMEKRFTYLGLVEKKHFYYHLVKYWRGVIDKFKPEVVIFPDAPHTVYDYVLFALLKLHGIKTLMFNCTWVCGRVQLINDYAKGSIKLQNLIYKNNKDFFISDLSFDLQEYYKNQINQAIDSTPSYVSEYIKRFSGLKKIKLKIKAIIYWIKDPVAFLGKVYGFLVKLFVTNLKKEYLNNQVLTLDFEKKYIYVPLHYQPECSTSAKGQVYVDQILMLEILSASLPPGWSIYVKEHVTQWLTWGLNFTSFRYRNYYRHIAHIKNVKIVPISTASFFLINYAQAVATVTGTAGWEAVLRSKPAMIFGYAWYMGCHGVFRVNSVSSCRNILDRIEGGLKVDQKKVINYLAILDKTTFRGYLSGWDKQETNISEEENKSNIFNALISEIESV